MNLQWLILQALDKAGSETIVNYMYLKEEALQRMPIMAKDDFGIKKKNNRIPFEVFI